MRLPNPAAAGQHGITMQLPPGTLSQLETVRAEELKRRQQRQQQQHQQRENTEKVTHEALHRPCPKSHQKEPTTKPRRLAPQRKKVFATPQSLKSGNSGTTGVSLSAPSADEQIPVKIPINATTTSERDDDIVGMFFDDQSSRDFRGRTGEMQSARVADWTDADLDNERTKTSKQLATDSDDLRDLDLDTISGNCDDNDAENQKENSKFEDSDEVDAFGVINEDDISLNRPPPTAPFVIVNLERLCGCLPADQIEKQVLVEQLKEALLGSAPSEEGNHKKSDCNLSDKETSLEASNTDRKGDGLSLDFDTRVVELFESGVAIHSDSSSAVVRSQLESEKKATGVIYNSKRECLEKENFENKTQQDISNIPEKETINPFAVIPYPEFLTSQQPAAATGLTEGTTSRSTLRLWKLLHHPHPLPLLNRLFTHLRNTSRSLIWKADMYRELSHLAQQEHRARLQRIRMEECREWKESVRKQRLDRLYDVRETFLLRVDVARKKYEQFVEKREKKVEWELCKRKGIEKKYKDSGGAHLRNEKAEKFEESFNELEDEDDGWKGVIREEEIIGGQINDEQFSTEQCFNSKNQSNVLDDDSPVGMDVFVSGPTGVEDDECNREIGDTSANDTSKSKISHANVSELQPITVSDNQQRISERLQKLKNHSDRNGNSKNFSKMNDDSLNEMFKTNDERVAEAVLRNLEHRLRRVDDLLESLQEEQWADEEEEEQNEGESASKHENDNETLREEDEITLLDQILAMILGALSKESVGAKNDEEHFRLVKEQHASIVQEWKKTFGRLPCFPFPEKDSGRDTDSADSDNADSDNFPPPKDEYVSELRSPFLEDRLILFSNDTADDWDEVEDWDALMP